MKKFKLKDHHFHFAHGWLWGVVILGLAILAYVGFAEGYFRYWMGNDFKIVNVHEVIQSSHEAEKLYDAMRNSNIMTTVLVGTPNEVIYYDGEVGFTGYEENNDEILAIQTSNPERFLAFCTIDPSDLDHLQVAKDCVEAGARGFKLYSGHSFFHEKSLADASMYEFYQYIDDSNLPLIFHVNTSKYQEEFEDVLTLYPNMKVLCPHFCLSSRNLQRLSYLFDTYPNLRTDISFGDETYLLEGVARISEDTETYREFINKYSDRFFYGTDAVVTDYEGKGEEWLTNLYQIYRDLLEEESYTVFLDDQEYRGLHLNYGVLEQIYETNWEAFLEDKN
jgi:predicted TIM-barrel fold metal-dependent hydrolase